MKSVEVLALSWILLPSASAFQQSRFVPGGLAPEKPQLLAIPGSVLPESGMLGPFADLDGDGDVDFLHGTRQHGNDGAGVFAAGRKVSLADERRIGFFDADADGRRDVLTRTHLYLGTAAGDFVDATSQLPAGLVTDAGVLADLDGDLDVDVLALQRHVPGTPGIVRLALNDGTGHFTESLLPSSSAPIGVAAGDVDGDSDLDLVVGGASLQLWRNDGSAGFTLDAPAIPAGSGSRALVLAQLDNDPDLDLVAGNEFGSGRLFVNDGTGAFTLISLPAPAAGKRTEAILVLDHDADGDPDLAFLDSVELVMPYGFLVSSAGDRLLENDGNGVFTATTALPAFLGESRAGFAGDLDGDSDVDIVVEDARVPNRVFWNDGSGAFALFPMPSGGGSIGDLNGDGLPDGFSVLGVLLNGPPGVFTPAGTSLPPPPTSCWDPYGPVDGPAALGDVDGDGDRDAYIAVGLNECGALNRMWINDGAANFTDQTSARLPAFGGFERAGIAMKTFLLPLDGDGDLDAACVRAEDGDGGGASSCYLNDGTGVFTRKETLGWCTRAAAFGDLDGDGDSDYFQGCDEYSPNSVLLNDGTAHFVELAGAVPAHVAPLDAPTVSLGDIDADGDLDAYVSAAPSFGHPVPPDAPPFFLYLNDGDGSFAAVPERVPTRIEGAFVDLDLDGDVDLLGEGDGRSRLLVNDGDGLFTEESERIGRFAGASVDLDLDGDPDGFSTRGLARHVEALGEPRIGKRFTLVVHGPAYTPFSLQQSLASAQISLGSAGWLLIDPGQIVSTHGGILRHDGEARVRMQIPANPALVGLTTYWQAFVGTPAHGTNLAVTTVTSL